MLNQGKLHFHNAAQGNDMAACKGFATCAILFFERLHLQIDFYMQMGRVWIMGPVVEGEA